VFSRCLFCHVTLPANDTFEVLTTGEQFAFDPLRGRLWVICTNCRRWNLIPLEARWENLEALEKIARDEARLLLQTENIALLRVGDVELVRVGQAHLPEEAWWRFGRELINRRARYGRIKQRMGVFSGALVLGGSVGNGLVDMLGLGTVLQNITREIKFGPTAWRGSATCPGCGSVLHELHFQNTNRVMLAQQPDGFELRYRCHRCHIDALHGGYRLTGISGEHLLRRILAYRHYEGAQEAHVKASTAVIEEIGSARDLTQRLALQRVHLGELPKPYALALEIAITQETEKKLLELEVAELEARWREEEELAAIVDEELSFLPRVLRAVPGRAAPESS
jgi:hypothetical protein